MPLKVIAQMLYIYSKSVNKFKIKLVDSHGKNLGIRKSQKSWF